ncbi:MAG: hypothetical protein V7L26_15080 [Nostoc sp.]|uniref:hypothetical protein n=1 Tax=Nostoc sp. TaxID=1180 RepID=UPI002FF39634
MPQSPFVSLANAMLTFLLPGVAADIDPITGNRMFVAGESLVVAAMLRQVSGYNFDRLPGLDRQAIYLQGRIVSISQGSERLETLLLTNIIHNEARAAATWDGLNGEFVILRQGHSPFKTEETLGDRIVGWFEIKSN